MSECHGKPWLDRAKWQKKREHILKRDGYQCQLSKRYGKNIQAEMVHHIFPRSEYPQYALSDWNLISLSLHEHQTLHGDNGELSEKGIWLLRRTAAKNNIEIPDKFK